MSQKTRNRRIRLIRPSLQLRLIGAFVGIAALGLVLQVLVLGAAMTTLADEMGWGGRDLAVSLPSTLGKGLLVSAVVVLPSMLLIGIRITHRIAGPLYRMEQHLNGIARGEEVQPCKIRQGDELQEFCSTLNRAIDQVKGGEKGTVSAAEVAGPLGPASPGVSGKVAA